MLGIESRVLTLAEYKEVDLSAVAAPFSMGEEELTKEMEKLRSRYGTMEAVETIETGDIVTLKLQGESPRFNKASVQVRVGKGLLDRELEEKLVGLSLQETVSLTTAGEPVEVTVLDIRRRQLAPLTDEAVATWGLEDISTVEGLKASIISKKRNQYVEDMSEALAVYLNEEVCRRSTFALDEGELETARQEGHSMAVDMLRSSGLNPDTATDEEVQAVTGGRTRQEHFAFVETLCMEGVKSDAIGALLMEQEQVPLPTEEAYEKALSECAEGMGLSLEEAKKVLTHSRFYRQTAANYLFFKLEAYCKAYLTNI